MIGMFIVNWRNVFMMSLCFACSMQFSAGCVAIAHTLTASKHGGANIKHSLCHTYYAMQVNWQPDHHIITIHITPKLSNIAVKTPWCHSYHIHLVNMSLTRITVAKHLNPGCLHSRRWIASGMRCHQWLIQSSKNSCDNKLNIKKFLARKVATLLSLSSLWKSSAISSGDVPNMLWSCRYCIPFLGFLLNLWRILIHISFDKAINTCTICEWC